MGWKADLGIVQGQVVFRAGEHSFTAIRRKQEIKIASIIINIPQKQSSYNISMGR